MTTSTNPDHQAPHTVTATLVPMTDLDALRAAGLVYPKTVDGWRWLYRIRHERGLDRAFCRVGRRVLVDVPAYLNAIRGNAA